MISLGDRLSDLQRRRYKQYKTLVANTIIKSVSNRVYVDTEKACLGHLVAHCRSLATQAPRCANRELLAERAAGGRRSEAAHTAALWHPLEAMNRLIEAHLENLSLLGYVRHVEAHAFAAASSWNNTACALWPQSGHRTKAGNNGDALLRRDDLKQHGGTTRTSRAIIKKTGSRLSLQIDLQTSKALWAAQEKHHKKLVLLSLAPLSGQTKTGATRRRSGDRFCGVVVVASPSSNLRRGG